MLADSIIFRIGGRIGMGLLLLFLMVLGCERRSDYRDSEISRPCPLDESQLTVQNKADTCGEFLFVKIDSSEILVSSADDGGEFDSNGRLQNGASLWVIKFPRDSVRQYSFCSDLYVTNYSDGDYYSFSSGSIFQCFLEKEGRSNFVVYVKDAYFKYRGDSIRIENILLWRPENVNK
jgi:hypothetical protein